MEIEKLRRNIEEFLKKNATPKNIVLLLAGLTLISFLTFFLLMRSPERDFGVLYTHLSPDDAGEILSVLQENHIPYKVEGDGSIILVPKNKVYEVRLKLAAKGIPHGKTVGFEIFEEPKLGMTQFQEHVEYLRALEGELERTITEIDAVKEAKVNIALPKESIFVREEEEPKASVLIDLWPGKDLTPEQVKAIVFLVSHAVPKLKPENVEVVDNRGRVLTDLIENKDETGAPEELKIKRKLEREIERKVRSMLSKVLGSGKVVVSASVEIETGKIKTKKELYDPDLTAVVSQRKIQEKETGPNQQPQGIPGSTTNIPPVVNTGSSSQNLKKEKKDITTNYDVSKTIEESVTPVFRIKRITVGVLVDGKYKKIKTKNGTIEYKFVPRPPEEIKIYENIVKSAIGYDPKRGDIVNVASVPFESRILTSKAESKKENPLRYALIGAGLLVALISLGIGLKLLKGKKAEAPPQEEMKLPEALMAEVAARKTHKEELEEIQIEQDPIYLKIVELGKEYPDLLSNIVSKWLREEGIR